ncbi:MAG: hypothetical protein IJ725_03940, partial [Ruminococcus sp.]|nr:hypothetical protein [Ruminococcus sp.]
MRSSNYKHLNKDNSKAKHAQPVNKVKKYSKIGSLAATAIIVIAAVVIPSISLVQNVAAVSDEQKTTLNIGDSDILGNAVEAATEQETTKATEPATEKETEPETEPETEEVTEAVTEEETVEETEAAESYSSGSHIELSDYDRTLLEGLVMGEVGGYGY